MTTQKQRHRHGLIIYYRRETFIYMKASLRSDGVYKLLESYLQALPFTNCQIYSLEILSTHAQFLLLMILAASLYQMQLREFVMKNVRQSKQLIATLIFTRDYSSMPNAHGATPNTFNFPDHYYYEDNATPFLSKERLSFTGFCVLY